MKLIARSDIRAALIASLVSGPVFWYGHYLIDHESFNQEQWWVILIGPVFWQVFTYPISVAGMFFIGLPLHAALRLTGYQAYLAVGVLGGPAVVLVHELVFSEGVYDQITILFICCGAAVSALYAALSKAFNKAIHATSA